MDNYLEAGKPLLISGLNPEIPFILILCVKYGCQGKTESRLGCHLTSVQTFYVHRQCLTFTHVEGSLNSDLRPATAVALVGVL